MYKQGRELSMVTPGATFCVAKIFSLGGGKIKQIQFEEDQR